MHIRYTFGAIAIAFIGVLALNYSGFCYSQLRWMSNDEYIRRAVEERWSRGYLRDRYSSVDDFLARRPRCCTVYRFSNPMTDKWSSVNLISPRAVVTVSYPAVEDGEHLLYEAKIIVKACGKPSFDLGYGTPIRY